MTLLVLRGRPGTGKTTISTALSLRSKIPILRKDDLYDVISGSVTEHDTRNRLTYAYLYRVLETNLVGGGAFILDYPFQSPADLSELRRWAKGHCVVLKTVLVTCSDEALWSERINARARDPRPSQTITDFETMRRRYGQLQLTPGPDELAIDTVEPLAMSLDKVVRFLDS